MRRIDTISSSTDSKIVLSDLHQYGQEQDCAPISIKMVLEGEENYIVNKQHYKVTNNKYIIVNEGDEYEVGIDTKQLTKGLCIYPPLDLIKDVFFSHNTNTNRDFLEAQQIKNTPFLTHHYDINATSLGKYLKIYTPILRGGGKNGVDFMEFYMGLAEAMIGDQAAIENNMSRLRVAKRYTREELYRRLMLVRDYMHDNKNKKISLEEISQLSHLSKYHFIRSFKDLFKQSPYQYMLSLKLDSARKLLSKGLSYREVTELIGFSDSKNLKRALKK